MPRFDGTGPNGKGLMTGRKKGNCVDNVDKVVKEVRGKGLGRGKGRSEV
jgi:hypothetical protein